MFLKFINPIYISILRYILLIFRHIFISFSLWKKKKQLSTYRYKEAMKLNMNESKALLS